ncbi:hypothetical protein CEP54_016213, partial [Fusarium duplospermum]
SISLSCSLTLAAAAMMSSINPSSAPRPGILAFVGPLTRAAQRRADHARQAAAAAAAVVAVIRDATPRAWRASTVLWLARALASVGPGLVPAAASGVILVAHAAQCNPTAALPVALFFLDYVQQAPSRVNKTEKNKRRIAVKVVLKGVTAGDFPLAGDPRLA